MKVRSDWRVVYGENYPSWEQIFRTRREARIFAKNQKRCGDIIFSIKRVVKGELPQSITELLKHNGVV